MITTITIFFSLMLNTWGVTGQGSIYVPIQVNLGAFDDTIDLTLSGAPYIDLNLQKPFIISAIGFTFVAKIAISFLPPGLNSFVIIDVDVELSFKRDMIPDYLDVLSDVEFETWTRRFPYEHQQSRSISSVPSNGYLNEVDFVFNSFSFAKIATSDVTGDGNVMCLWIDLDPSFDMPSSTTVVWSIYNAVSGSWENPQPLERSSFAESVPSVTVYESESILCFFILIHFLF